jgi:mono/diheme cytochrome c family protein
LLGAASTAGILLLVLGGLLIVLAGGALYLRGRTRERRAPIPDGMKPGPSDAALETPLLQKLQGWGVVLVAFLALWMPFTWLREPSQNLRQEEDLKQTAIARGQAATQLFTETNPFGVGCVRCHGPELRGMPVQSGDTVVLSANLTTVCGGPFTGHANIFSTADIQQVIMEGRNVMPSWSIRFQGALDDQQINDLVNYLVWMSSKNVPFKDNVCLNPDASARALQQNIDNGSPIDPRDP